MKYFSYLLLATYFITLSPEVTLAHILTTDDAVGAVIHIEPKDDPIANAKSTIIIDLKDKNGHFKYTNCTCNISISTNGKNIFSQVLSRTNSTKTVDFIFPEIGSYKINISGTPDNNESFKAFNLNHLVEISKSNKIDKLQESNSNSDLKNKSTTIWVSTHTVHLVGAFFLLGVILYSIIKERKNK